MDPNGLIFGRQWLLPDHITGKRVLEIGSLDVNGSLKHLAEIHKPAEYIGVDQTAGKGVDVVAKIEDTDFAPESFDTVICVSCIEHAPDWRAVVKKIKEYLKPGGLLVFSVPAPGFPRHEFPGDYWRFTAKDIGKIFEEFSVMTIFEFSEDDEPQTYFAGLKPKAISEPNLDEIEPQKVPNG